MKYSGGTMKHEPEDPRGHLREIDNAFVAAIGCVVSVAIVAALGITGIIIAIIKATL